MCVANSSSNRRKLCSKWRIVANQKPTRLKMCETSRRDHKEWFNKKHRPKRYLYRPAFSVLRRKEKERKKSCFELHWMFEQTFHSKRSSKSGRARRTKPCIGVAKCIDFHAGRTHTLRWMAAEINGDETKVKRNESLEKCHINTSRMCMRLGHTFAPQARRETERKRWDRQGVLNENVVYGARWHKI